MIDTASIQNLIECVHALIASGRISEAAGLMEHAVFQSPAVLSHSTACAKDPEKSRLLTCYFFCKYQETGETDDLERLAAWASACKDRQSAEEICTFARELRQIPYVEYLPDFKDKVTECLHCLPGEAGDVSLMKLTAAVWPAASSRNALFLTLSNYRKQTAELSISVTHPTCDSYESPLAPEGLRLWNYQKDHTPVPAVPKPEKQVYKLADNLAREPFHLGKWYEKARELSRSLTVQDADSLYGCMVYPQEPEAQITSDRWLFRIQCAAICLLAHLRDESLPDSLTGFPSPELARICLGQLDWPVIPALTLLAWQVREKAVDPGLVNPILDRLIASLPGDSPCFYEHALFSAVSWIPGRSRTQRARAQRRRYELEAARTGIF